MAYIYKLDNPKTELSMSDMADIHEFYSAACTAEYFLDNQEEFDIEDEISEDEALAIGFDARRQMDKYGYDESEAIRTALKLRGYDV